MKIELVKQKIFNLKLLAAGVRKTRPIINLQLKKSLAISV